MVLSSAQRRAIVWAASVAIHVWIAVGVASIDKAKVKRGPTSISMRDNKKKKTEEKKPEPAKEKPPEPKIAEAKKPPPAPKRPATQPEAPKPAAEAAPAPVNAAAAAPVADLGLTFGNALGSGPGGIHVPTNAGNALAAPTASAKPQPKVLGPKAGSPGGVDECTEPPAKPKPIKVVQPAYTTSAREAQVEGRVRVEITVDANGNVTGAKVLQGLGHGLDESALAAAKASTFSAAVRCGKSVPATFVIGMRFAL